MASDLAFATFWFPVMVCVALLGITAWKIEPAPPGLGFAGVGVKRISLGYLGALLATLIYSFIDTVRLGLNKVQLGHIEQAELIAWVPYQVIYMFVIYTPFVVFLLTVLGLPYLTLQSRLRFNSLLGSVAIATLLSVLYALSIWGNPTNSWCSLNLEVCVSQSFWGFWWPACLVAVLFALFVSLPRKLSERPSET